VRKIASLIEPYVTGERGCTALVAFDERVQWLQECTRNYVELKQAFARLQHGEPKRARMLDAAQEAIERLKKRANSRRVLLLISESRDRGSKVSLDDIRVAAQAADVVVYATTYSAFKTAFTSKSSATGEPEAPKKIYRRADQTGTINGQEEGHANPSLPPAEQRVDILGGLSELSRLGKANTTQVLTSATGGDTFPFTREKGLIEAIQKLGVELHTQYMLSFTPATPDPGYHRIEVRLMRRGDFHVRARTGYWSTN
jgi:VWFA-related protein